MAAAGPRQPTVDPVIAHRGASGDCPENTLISLQRAADLGCKWVEVDCQLTRDGRIVLMHDADLAKTTGDPRDVHLVDFAEVQGLDAGAWFGDAFAGEPIPTLEAAVEVMQKNGQGAIVEVKAGNNDPVKVAKAVAGHLLAGWPESLPTPVLCSFSDDVLAACAAVAPDLPRGISFWEVPPDWDVKARRHGCTAIHANHNFLAPETARAMIDAGYTLRAYTVNDPDRAAALFGLGVASVFSDFPGRMPAG